MRERSALISCIRGELVGPSQPPSAVAIAEFAAREYVDPVRDRRGPLAWCPDSTADPQEVLYYQLETPHRKYGAGLLHPAQAVPVAPEQAAADAADTLGVDIADPDAEESGPDGAPGTAVDLEDTDDDDDFEVVSPDIWHPSTIGMSFCAKVDEHGEIIVSLPRSRKFSWQSDADPPFQVNGRYERCTRRWTSEHGDSRNGPIWRRIHAVPPDAVVTIKREELAHGTAIEKDVAMPDGSPLSLRVEALPRLLNKGVGNVWLVTIILRNATALSGAQEPREAVLYQAYFEVAVRGGTIEKYPESQRPFAKLDAEEQSLVLLYRESATWGIGHGCAAAWDAEPGDRPPVLYADVMPAVELPSMTPDIKDGAGNPIHLSMRSLANLSASGAGPEWQSLNDLAQEYGRWIQDRKSESAREDFPPDLREVARRHLDACDDCVRRINQGISLLRDDPRVLRAFKLANLAMLLQQIATKELARRPLHWDAAGGLVQPQGEHRSPWAIYQGSSEGNRVGSWRAFQIAFLLMSLDGVRDGLSADREIVDLIWFPTGGGKTEAYLAVMAFYMFHERLQIATPDAWPRRDGTNVLMRYTLRMLTTQQFQRAASLICAMEYLRGHPEEHGLGQIPGLRRFSLGLWIGRGGSPNKIADATEALREFRNGRIAGNPLVLTECPWCRAEIGRYQGNLPKGKSDNVRIQGIRDVAGEGPLLHCTDGACDFGREPWETWLPVEVVDERIYRHPPSLVIATADKLAMIAYRPAAGALFGRQLAGSPPLPTGLQENHPPGLIIQDELHLISGPLGTMYALYEGIFERLCSHALGDQTVRPKLIASTATIRGAKDQVMALYARTRTQLFPSPGLLMGDSFFGTYAREGAGSSKLSPGRLYLGIHTSDYGSTLTAQVRTFSSALFRPFYFSSEKRDPWWTLLTFYNSIRELGGGRTLFDADIRSRLKFMFSREGAGADDRRNLRIVEELTSRLSQAEIVGMMDRLSAAYSPSATDKTIDVCLASSIIEVGVDIERLSLMGVVGQPKTTAQYIQVTGRVGRRWRERPGLILMIYSPSKSRDRSHFEQFHSYHRRLYERVEPTSATPFALSAIQRSLPGALIAWARQQFSAPVNQAAQYEPAVKSAFQTLSDRCQTVQSPEDQQRSLKELESILNQIIQKWRQNPQEWEAFPQDPAGEYLMLWPGQYATEIQKTRGVEVASSMRQVDASAELTITQGYAVHAPSH